MSTRNEIQACMRSGKRARTVSPWGVISEAVRQASRDGYGADVEHGGGVPNCYSYPASSECFGAVAVRTHGRGGRLIGSYATLPANKITLSGAANATLGERASWDARMTDDSACRARLREWVWLKGDGRWMETQLGGLYYHISGYGWRLVPSDRTLSPHHLPKRALRVMRRLCPDGWSVVMTPASQGAAPSPAWRCGGEQYHVASSPARGRYIVAGSIAAARAAFAAREKSNQDAALAALLDSGAARDVYICAADSYRAGNCVTGTASFASRNNLDVRRHYSIGDLIALANGDAKFVRAAALAGMRRERREMERGYALLQEHVA